MLKVNGASVTFLIKDSVLSPLADAALKSFIISVPQCRLKNNMQGSGTEWPGIRIIMY